MTSTEQSKDEVLRRIGKPRMKEQNLKQDDPSVGLTGLLSVEYHKKCHDCGQFLKKELWVRKDHPRKSHGLCGSCYSNYDNPWDY